MRVALLKDLEIRARIEQPALPDAAAVAGPGRGRNRRRRSPRRRASFRR
ncbi:hypothetical protein ACRAWD_23960 [Caulobacter segnis]